MDTHTKHLCIAISNKQPVKEDPEVAS